MRPTGGRPDRLPSSSEYVRQPNPNVFISGHLAPRQSHRFEYLASPESRTSAPCLDRLSPLCWCNGMLPLSSIKRDVKKKVLPRPDAEKIFVSRCSPLPVSVPLRFARE